MWSVSTIITGLISFMVESAPTLGSIETSTLQKKKLAKESLEYNVKDETFKKLFPDLVKLCHEQLEQRKKELGYSGGVGNGNSITGSSEVRVMGLERNMDELNTVWALCAGFVAVLSIICAMRFL